MKRILTTALILGIASLALAKDAYAPEQGSAELKKKPVKKAGEVIDEALPMVLILGDSISIGYTPTVKQTLQGKANVIHNPGNSQGTTHTLKNLDSWLKMHKWDVIHFNLGLHDLKRVKEAGASNNSNDPADPRQADLPTYTANLEKIVQKLKASGARLIFATTTPYPAGVKPHRDPEDAVKYNEAALKIMKANGIQVNDLYSLILPDLNTLQQPVNVHFKPAGSEKMGKQTADMISKALEKS